MLEIKNLNVSIGGSRILRDVAFRVPAKEVVCLMGRNGVGKTTTLKSILGLREVTTGSIVLDGVEISKWDPDARVRAGIGYVPQGREIFPALTVLENLQISQVAVGRKSPERFERVFALFPVLKEMLHRKGGVLSGGQQQQLAIGRALLTEPKLLILDEPTEGIQPSIIDQIGDAILRLKGEVSVLLVEQYLDFAKELGDRFVIMDRGSVVAQGAIGELHEGVVKQYLTV
jgi:urea transport system ATP-binding protein